MVGSPASTADRSRHALDLVPPTRRHTKERHQDCSAYCIRQTQLARPFGNGGAPSALCWPDDGRLSPLAPTSPTSPVSPILLSRTTLSFPLFIMW